MIITIDGDSFSGKNTLSTKLENELSWKFFTKTFYRALTLKALNLNINADEEERLSDMTHYTSLRLEKDGFFNVRCYMNGNDVTKYLYNTKVNRSLKKYSQSPSIKNFVQKVQAKESQKVDNGIFVVNSSNETIQNADVKILLTCDDEERAKRHFIDIEYKETDKTFEDVLKDVKQDKTIRTNLDGITVINTTNLTEQETMEKAMGIINSKIVKHEIEARHQKQNHPQKQKSEFEL